MQTYISVDREMKSDTKVWLDFLKQDPHSVCRLFVNLSQALVAEKIFFYTDVEGSAQLSLGCMYDCDWVQQNWEYQFILQKHLSIEYLELYTIMVTIYIWAEDLSNSRVINFCDNYSIVHSLDKSTSSCRNGLILLRLITMMSLKYIRFFWQHVIGKSNILADKLSRGMIDQFWACVKQLNIPMNPENTLSQTKYGHHQNSG